ncbi:MAG TPA: lysylphosphatidylglycerol synthase domain-containing protein [Gaiellaceae bacterium]|nr:lysylphosphatidylglycerol synthase domain-containing protein [Gaiellaceae bacterium]
MAVSSTEQGSAVQTVNGRAAAMRDALRLLTVEEAGRRNRRTIDGVLIAFGALVLGLAAVAAANAPAQDEQVGKAIVTVLGWAEGLWRGIFIVTVGYAVLVVVDVFWRRRFKLARDLALALVLVIGAGMALGWAVESDWTPFREHLLARWGFPELRLAAAVAVLVVAGPELVRPARRLAAALGLLAALSVVALGAALPSAAFGALSLGLAVGALIRLTFGTAAGVPPTAHIRGELAALGVEVATLKPAADQKVGYATYVGTDAGGKPLRTLVLGRDAQDTQRLARRWRQLAYRDPPRSVAIGRLQQVEHEALATLMAAQAGVRVPEVVTAALGPEGDALIVTRLPDVTPLENANGADVPDSLLDELWGQAATLHGAGISHGRLNLRNVMVVDGAPVLSDFSAATLGAPASALDIDVAELLVACTVLVGPDRALRAACRGKGIPAIASALPYLERAALTPHLRDLARQHDVELKSLRAAAAESTDEKLPELAQIHRVRPRDFLFTALIALAAYLLISKLAKIGFGTIAEELRHSDLVWVVVALLLAQLSYVPQAIAFRGAVPTPLPLLPCVILESALKFLNLTVPASAGSIAASVRFLQRLGAKTGEAFASTAVIGLADTILQIALVLVLLPFVHVQLDTRQIGDAIPPGRFIVLIAIVLVVVIGAVLAIPALRRKVLPGIRSALSSLWAIARNRRKLLELFGGSLGKELLFALTLGAACLAYGVHLSLAQLLIVNVISSTLASLVPVPGGIGAAEAAISAGLVAMGVEETTAFAIALTHRLCTYYLPPIWGYASLHWLQRKGYV